MKKINLSSLSIQDLQQLKADIDSEISRRSDRIAAIEAIKQLASEKGLKFEDLLVELGGTKTKTRRESGPVPVRYRNGSNPSQTWSGRGKRPTWLAEAIAKGASLESFLV